MTTSVNDLLNQEPENLLKWLESVASGKTAVSEEPNWWLGIAQSAVSHARTEVNPKAKKLWAEIAVWVYNYLATTLNPEARTSYEISARMFSVTMVEELGAVAGDPVLDPNLIEEWFFRRLTLSREEVAEKAANWQTRPIEEIRQLRELKMRLNVVEELRRRGYLQNNVELSKWLELKNKLP